MFRSGLWITSGYQVNDGNNFSAVWRFLFNPDKIIAEPQNIVSRANISTFDTGLQYSFQKPGGAFSFSSEFIFRSVLNNNSIPSTYRWTTNFGYVISDNIVLTLALGRDFDRTFKNDGNFIGLINLIAGFGSKRAIE